MKSELEVRTDTIKQLAKKVNINLKCKYCTFITKKVKYLDENKVNK